MFLVSLRGKSCDWFRPLLSTWGCEATRTTTSLGLNLSDLGSARATGPQSARWTPHPQQLQHGLTDLRCCSLIWPQKRPDLICCPQCPVSIHMTSDTAWPHILLTHLTLYTSWPHMLLTHLTSGTVWPRILVTAYIEAAYSPWFYGHLMVTHYHSSAGYSPDLINWLLTWPYLLTTHWT